MVLAVYDAHVTTRRLVITYLVHICPMLIVLVLARFMMQTCAPIGVSDSCDIYHTNTTQARPRPAFVRRVSSKAFLGAVECKLLVMPVNPVLLNINLTSPHLTSLHLTSLHLTFTHYYLSRFP